MTQKLIKIGSSAGVIIPKSELKKLNVVVGDEVEVVVKRAAKTTISPELHEWTNKFIDQYRPVLDALAKK